MNQIAALLERTVVMDDNSIGISYSPTNRRTGEYRENSCLLNSHVSVSRILRLTEIIPRK